MSWGQRLRVALRYTFAFGRGYLSTFLSSLSTLGLVLAIALLITVLSVMNGFDKEMRERILSLVPHVSLLGAQGLEDWQTVAADLAGRPEVRSVRPFAQFDALFAHGDAIVTTQGLGIMLEAGADDALVHFLSDTALARFAAADNGLILGAEVAARLGVEPGDALTLIAPSLAGGGQNSSARFERLVLCGVLNSGTELDQSLALVPLPLASSLAQLEEGRVSGLQLGIADIFSAPRIAWELVQDQAPTVYAINWMQTHGNLYASIQLSRDLVSILLFSIIAVAAFNVVSSLVLVVFDKQGDIAILRTLGASKADLGWVFIIQGALIGLVGVVLGCLFGVALSLAVPHVVNGLELLLNYRFLSTDVYPVSFLPVDVRLADVALIGAVSFLMCLAAAVYPALRAARLAPALVLHEQSV